MARITQDDIQPVMDLLDLLRDVRTAIEDVSSGEWEREEKTKLTLQDMYDKPVSFVHGLPPSVVLAGLRAMEGEVQALLQARDIQVVELS
jgi:hypothetical protein